jgi:hypothetical protein
VHALATVEVGKFRGALATCKPSRQRRFERGHRRVTPSLTNALAKQRKHRIRGVKTSSGVQPIGSLGLTLAYTETAVPMAGCGKNDKIGVTQGSAVARSGRATS